MQTQTHSPSIKKHHRPPKSGRSYSAPDVPVQSYGMQAARLFSMAAFGDVLNHAYRTLRESVD